jgi:hypothetical protein
MAIGAEERRDRRREHHQLRPEAQPALLGRQRELVLVDVDWQRRQRVRCPPA